METKDKIAKRIFNLIGKYIETCNKDGECLNNFLYIIDNASGEILTFSANLKSLKDNIRFIKEA
jgi:hypothetical protein